MVYFLTHNSWYIFDMVVSYGNIKDKCLYDALSKMTSSYLYYSSQYMPIYNISVQVEKQSHGSRISMKDHRFIITDQRSF
jgi:hypothetical protein